jgi:hypothetical protein
MTVLYRAINDDGSLSLFVSIANVPGIGDTPPVETEPELDLQNCIFHEKDGKPYTLEIRVGAWGNTPSKGDMTQSRYPSNEFGRIEHDEIDLEVFIASVSHRHRNGDHRFRIPVHVIIQGGTHVYSFDQWTAPSNIRRRSSIRNRLPNSV